MAEPRAVPQSEINKASSETGEEAKSPEQQEAERVAREAAKPSEAAEQSRRESRRRKEKEKNEELVLDWLIKETQMDQIDPELFAYLKKAMEQKDEESESAEKENLDETAKLLRLLPQVFKQFDEKVSELSKSSEYKEIGRKRIEIIKSLCTGVIKGHLKAGDVVTMVAGVEIVSKTNFDTPEQKRRVERMLEMSGYDGMMFFQPDEGKLVIFDDTLKDATLAPDGTPLDLHHMINHEVSHGISERLLVGNKSLREGCQKIITAAESLQDKLKGTQSLHIQNVLTGLANAERDFEKHFKKKFGDDPKFKNPDGSINENLKDEIKEKYIDGRKHIAAKEIITDYTAIYLQSDGSFGDFFEKCIIKSGAIGNETDAFAGASRSEIEQINKTNDPDEKKKIIEELGQKHPAFAASLDIFKTFYGEIRKQLVENKGKITDLDQDDEEDYLSDYFGGSFSEPGQGTNAQPSSGSKGESLLGAIGGLIKAMAGEAPGANIGGN